MTQVKIDENEWIDRFKPETMPDGSYYRQRDPYDLEDTRAIERALEEHRLWTGIEDDEGRWNLIFGYHYVNRLYYVICEVPYDLADATEEVYVCDDEQETITD